MQPYSCFFIDARPGTEADTRPNIFFESVRFRLIIMFPSLIVNYYPFAAVNGVIYYTADRGRRTRAVSKEPVRPSQVRIQTAGLYCGVDSNYQPGTFSEGSKNLVVRLK